jgi:hypothetical protein
VGIPVWLPVIEVTFTSAPGLLVPLGVGAAAGIIILAIVRENNSIPNKIKRANPILRKPPKRYSESKRMKTYKFSPPNTGI